MERRIQRQPADRQQDAEAMVHYLLTCSLNVALLRSCSEAGEAYGPGVQCVCVCVCLCVCLCVWVRARTHAHAHAHAGGRAGGRVRGGVWWGGVGGGGVGWGWVCVCVQLLSLRI